MVFSILQSTEPLWATDYCPGFVDLETEAPRPSSSRQTSCSGGSLADPGSHCIKQRGHLSQVTSCLHLSQGWGSLLAGAFLRLEAREVPLLSGTLFPSSLEFSSGPGSPLPHAFKGLPKAFQMFPKKNPDLLLGLQGWPDTTLLYAA